MLLPLDPLTYLVISISKHYRRKASEFPVKISLKFFQAYSEASSRENRRNRARRGSGQMKIKQQAKWTLFLLKRHRWVIAPRLLPDGCLVFLLTD